MHKGKRVREMIDGKEDIIRRTWAMKRGGRMGGVEDGKGKDKGKIKRRWEGKRRSVK